MDRQNSCTHRVTKISLTNTVYYTGQSTKCVHMLIFFFFFFTKSKMLCKQHAIEVFRYYFCDFPWFWKTYPTTVIDILRLIWQYEGMQKTRINGHIPERILFILLYLVVIEAISPEKPSVSPQWERESMRMRLCNFHLHQKYRFG